MTEKNIAISASNHRKIRKLSDETGIKIKALVNQIIQEGYGAVASKNGSNRVSGNARRKNKTTGAC